VTTFSKRTRISPSSAAVFYCPAPSGPDPLVISGGGVLRREDPELERAAEAHLGRLTRRARAANHMLAGAPRTPPTAQAEVAGASTRRCASRSRRPVQHSSSARHLSKDDSRTRVELPPGREVMRLGGDPGMGLSRRPPPAARDGPQGRPWC